MILIDRHKKHIVILLTPTILFPLLKWTFILKLYKLGKCSFSFS